ncbi:MAG: saccharopine dehydrogenase NADP-binding domain-containing protein [Psychrobacter sp.]|nr:saccharopine dehydrogenase NADP-binding domain-containing protein [Psychrobacter sp.]
MTSSMTQNSDSNNDLSRDYTLVLYGATSFVGQITARYLTQFLSQSHAAEPIRWAIAGRNKDKLERLKNQLGQLSDMNKVSADALPDIIIADSEDDTSLDTLCQRSKLVISTVGPYLKYGEPMIRACVNNGTDYVDLTGEAIFIKDMMDKYHDKAVKTGARIVNACGFDSIPSDLGVYFTQQQAKIQFDAPCSAIQMRVKAAKGGLSGGTISSMATIFAEVSKDKSRRKQLANPYLLNQDSNPPTTRQPTHNLPSFDKDHERWLAPFIMDTINTRIVHHSNQLLGYAYGRQFKYDEAMWMPVGLKGRAMSYGLSGAIGGFAAAMSFEKSRDILLNHVLPKSGDGPSPDDQKNGYFDLRFFGQVANDKQISTKVTGDKDPGYGSTSQMLAQAALCLVQDIDKETIGGGFWTPASAMGSALLERLQHNAGIKFAIL